MGDSIINSLHDLAMDIMNEAEALKDKDIALAKKYFLQAFELERYAAERVAALPESSEPSRSMLFLGAASIALRILDYKKAKAMASRGLDGQPSGKTLKELQKILKGSSK